ncbi:phage minor capsid protein [Eubacteriales bacterium OttesenSCG-928-K08]|nr:phage minor capsid protein [Eubacteriales bacterium OttesenSCG-928-K08]
MLDPEYFANFTDDILALYEAYQTSLCNEIARRIARMGGVTRFSVEQMEILQEAGLVYQDAISMIAEIVPESREEVSRMFFDMGTRTLAYDDAVYIAAGLSPIPLSQSPQMLDLLMAGISKTNGDLFNLTMTTATTSQTSFINAVSLASMQVETGAMSYQQAITNAIKSISGDGAWIQYPPKTEGGIGHRDRIDVAVRRATLTGTAQTTAQMQDMRMNEMNCQCVEVSAHVGARPTHAAWQGGVYTRYGRIDGYEDLVDATGYGSGDGLCGWNCSHKFYPFFIGISERKYSKESLEELNNKTVSYNGEEIEAYKATQMQRALERKIRETKRQLSALDASIKDAPSDSIANSLKSEFTSLSTSLKDQERKLNDFTAQTDLWKDTSRTQVDGFGRSVSQKARWAAQNAV